MSYCLGLCTQRPGLREVDLEPSPKRVSDKINRLRPRRKNRTENKSYRTARGCCSKCVLWCFKKLGFNNKLIRNAIKKLSKSAMECCFCIWLARNTKEWAPPATNCKLNDSSKETYNSPSSTWSLKQTNKPVSNAKSIRPVGFINKGNTCYANSILQILSFCLPSGRESLWNQTLYHLCYELSVSTWL